MSSYKQLSLLLARTNSVGMRVAALAMFLLLAMNACMFAEQRGIKNEETKNGDQEIDRNVSSSIDLKNLLSDLESPMFERRREAFLQLWKSGPSVLDRLDNSGVQFSNRVQPQIRWLRLLSRLDVSHERVSDSLQNMKLLQFENFFTIQTLAKKGKWTELFTLWSFLSPTQQQSLISSTSSYQILELCSLAVEQGRQDLLPILADNFMPVPQAIINRFRWSEKGLIEAALEQSALKSTAYFECLTLERQKEFEDAADLASKRGVYGLSELILLRNFQWAAALDRIAAVKQDSEEISSPDQLSEIVKACLLAKWCNDLQLEEQLRQRILQASDSVKRNDMYPTALFMIGAWDESLELQKEKLDSSSFVLLYRLRGEKEAFAQFGIDPTDIASVEQRLVQSRTTFRKFGNNPKAHTEFSLLSTVSSLLHRLGSHHAAEICDSLLIESGLRGFGQVKSGEDNLPTLIRTWVRFNNESLAKKVVAENLAKNSNESNRIPWLRALAGNRASNSDMLLMTLHENLGRNWTQTVDAWVGLSRGTLPPGKDLEWFQQLANKAMVESEMLGEQGATASAILDLALLLSANDLIFRIVEEYPFLITSAQPRASDRFYSRSSTVLGLRFAQFLAKDGNYAVAAGVLGRFENASNGVPHIRGLRLKWLKQAGQVGLFERQKELIDWMPIPYQVRHQYYVSQAMVAGLEEYAIEYGKKAIAQVEFLYEDLHGIAFQIAQSIEERDPHEALNYIRFAQASLLANGQLTTVSPTRSLLYQAVEMRCELRIAIEERSWEKADSLFRRLAVSQTSTDVAIHFVPLAAAAFGDEKSDQWYRFYRDLLMQHLSDWPQDAMFLNNAAWMMANLDRELEMAQEYAEKAVELSDRYPVYLDTLAEVVFRRGDVSRALELSLECKSVDRTEDQYQQQINRFARVLIDESRPSE